MLTRTRDKSIKPIVRNLMSFLVTNRRISMLRSLGLKENNGGDHHLQLRFGPRGGNQIGTSTKIRADIILNCLFSLFVMIISALSDDSTGVWFDKRVSIESVATDDFQLGAVSNARSRARSSPLVFLLWIEKIKNIGRKICLSSDWKRSVRSSSQPGEAEGDCFNQHFCVFRYIEQSKSCKCVRGMSF